MGNRVPWTHGKPYTKDQFEGFLEEVGIYWQLPTIWSRIYLFSDIAGKWSAVRLLLMMVVKFKSAHLSRSRDQRH